MRFSRCAGSIIFMMSLFIEIKSLPSISLYKEELVIINTGDSALPPVSPTPSPVPSTTLPPKVEINTKPIIRSMHVESNVSSRYANTLVVSRVANPATKSNEVTFTLVIPETAFITAFSMELQGKIYEAYVKEKAEAKKIYEKAVSSGQAAAHVAVQARDSNSFTISVNMEPESKAVFRLRYEELLTRRLGLYNLVINLNPGQILDDLTVDVNVEENTPITKILVPELRTGNEIDAQASDAQNMYATTTVSEDRLNAKIHFSPTREQQMELIKIFKAKNAKSSTPSSHVTNPSSYLTNPTKELEEVGISGQFVVQYDVERTLNGDVLVRDGYFVHFFAPENLKPLSKHVIFVLDVSGSMAGRKINQLKEAMESILQDLNPGDFFNIMDFSYSAKVYNLDDLNQNAIYKSSSEIFYGQPNEPIQSPAVPPKPKPANTEYIKMAKGIIQNLQASGGTNIHDALTTALKIANYGIQVQETGDITEYNTIRHEPMIIFLTDGEPTVGETNINNILSAVSKLNSRKTAIFSLAFGEDADRNFLRKLSLQNYGFMRHIYEAADAAQQLKHFYLQISSPLLANITYKYAPDEVDNNSITKTEFEHFFMGSELIVAGRLMKSTVTETTIKVSATSRSGPIDFIPVIPQLKEAEKQEFWPLERLWAYLTIKQLLDENDSANDVTGGVNDRDPAKKALEIAMKYSFVTPLTSLVVVKPDTTSAVDVHSLQSLQPNAYPLSGISPLLGYSGSSGAGVGYAAAGPAPAYSAAEFPAPLGGYPTFSLPQAYRPPQPTKAAIPAALSGIPLSLRLASAHYVARKPISHIPTTTRVYHNMQIEYMLGIDQVDSASDLRTALPIQRALTAADSVNDANFESDEEQINTQMNIAVDSKSRLSEFNLQNYTWLEQYLSDTDNVITLPSEVKTTSYKLKTITDTYDDLIAMACSNSYGGGEGVCIYLTQCQDLSEAFKDLNTYLSYSCNNNGYAGVCCKPKVR